MLSFVVPCVLTILCSCQQEFLPENSNPPTQPDSSYLHSLHLLFEDVNGLADTAYRYNFEYDAAMRISTVYVYHYDSSLATLAYTTHYEYNGADTLCTFACSKDLATQLTDTVFYSYNSNAVMLADSLVGNGFTEVNRYEQVSGGVLRVHWLHSTLAGTTITDSMWVHQTYSGGRLVQEDEDDMHNPPISTSYSYDNSINPWARQSPVKTPLQLQQIYLAGGSTEKYNLSAIRYHLTAVGGPLVTNISYTYTHNGLPKTARAVKQGSPAETTLSIFNYRPQ